MLRIDPCTRRPQRAWFVHLAAAVVAVAAVNGDTWSAIVIATAMTALGALGMAFTAYVRVKTIRSLAREDRLSDVEYVRLVGQVLREL